MTSIRASLLVVAALAGCGGGSSGQDAGVDARAPGTDAPVLDAPALDASQDAPSLAVDAPRDAPDVVALDAASGLSFEAVLAEIESCDPDRFDRAMYDVAWSEGWPLEGTGRWLFATYLEDAPPTASLVGDLGGWDTARWPATRCGDGTRFYVVVDESGLTAPALRSKSSCTVGSSGDGSTGSSSPPSACAVRPPPGPPPASGVARVPRSSSSGSASPPVTK